MKIIQDKIKEFREKFCNVYPGDSGLGGNDPQEPVHEWATDDSLEVERWLSQSLQQMYIKGRESLKKEIQRKDVKELQPFMPAAFNSDVALEVAFKLGHNLCIDNILDLLSKRGGKEDL